MSMDNPALLVAGTRYRVSPKGATAFEGAYRGFGSLTGTDGPRMLVFSDCDGHADRSGGTVRVSESDVLAIIEVLVGGNP